MNESPSYFAKSLNDIGEFFGFDQKQRSAIASHLTQDIILNQQIIGPVF